MDKKRLLASELLRMTGSANLPNSRDAPDTFVQAMKRLNEMRFEAMTDLYAKHFSEEQLQYQLDFVKSDIGQSILETQQTISIELGSMLATLTDRLNLENSNIQNPEKGDVVVQLSSLISGENEPPEESDA